MLDQLLHYDNEIILFFNSLGNSTWDAFWVFITQPISWTWYYILCFFLVIKFYGWKKGSLLALAGVLIVATALISVHFIKNGVARLRPNNNPIIDNLLRTLVDPQAYSFVSGHATFSFTLGVLIFKILKDKMRFAWLLFVFPALFTYSRLYLGVHYLSDILTGVLLGILIGNIGWISIKKWILKTALTR